MSKIFEALQNVDCRVGDFDLRGVTDSLIPRNEIQYAGSSEILIQNAAALQDLPVTRNIRLAPLRIVPSSPLAVPFAGTHPVAGEQYRILRTRILQHPSQPRVLVVSSAAASDGKSTTATNLAFALALRSEMKVLLIDADMRRGAIASDLGLNPSPGLAEYLRGLCDLTSVITGFEQLPNLHVIAAGKEYVNPCELLDSERWRSTCALARDTYGFVILDSPPIGMVADYELLQNVADGVLLVMRPDNTNRKLAARALETVPKAKLIGVVLNCVSGLLMGDQDSYGGRYYYQKDAK